MKTAFLTNHFFKTMPGVVAGYKQSYSMKQLTSAFALLMLLYVAAPFSALAQPKVPLLKMTAVKAECQRVGTSFSMVLTITLDNWSYANFGQAIEYTLTGSGVTTQTLYATQANVNTPLLHIFSGVNLSAGITYSITANIPNGGVGGNTLTFVMKPCVGTGTISIDTSLIIIGPHSPCPTLVNLIPNGNFMYGNDGTFQSDLLAGCASCTAGTYCVGKDIKTKCSSWPASTWDHTLNNSSGSYLLVDGNPSAPSTVWFTNVKVCKGVTYTFSFWAKSLYPDAFNLGFMINNNLAAVPGSTVTVSGASVWRKYTISWPCTLPTGTTVPIGIRQITGGHKRDFGIDDILFGYCCECNKP